MCKERCRPGTEAPRQGAIPGTDRCSLVLPAEKLDFYKWKLPRENGKSLGIG